MILQISSIKHGVGKNSLKPYLKVNNLYYVHDTKIIAEIVSREGHAMNVEVRDPTGEFPAITKVLLNDPMAKAQERMGMEDHVEHVDMNKPRPAAVKQSIGSTINRQSALKSAVSFYPCVEDKSVDILFIAERFLGFIEDRE